MIKIAFLAEADTAIRLGFKSPFAEIGLNTSDFILGLLSLFKHLFIEHLLYARTVIGTGDITVTKRIKYCRFHGICIPLGEGDPDNKQINE